MPQLKSPRKILARSPKRAIRGLTNLPQILSTMLAVRLFRNPFSLLSAYLSRTCPESLRMETRSGYKILLSGDQDDVVTVLVVIGRKDYGPIPKGATVLDVGAHLGAFTLYAIMGGAARVYSFEPDPLLYATLQRNVKENGLEGKVQAFQAAVMGQDCGTVTFHPAGNASGHVKGVGDDLLYKDGSAGVTVKALALSVIVTSNQLETIGLLKLDCEGSEYGIVFDTAREIWDRIERVRLEYHNGRAGELQKHLEELGFRMVWRHSQSRNVGLMWFDRGR
ncbi:hypothetical protein SBA3_3740014 [Candidatus Sulfopaludibacter sp. SbA3]|nr:hypothetical protein SBA3_3740014 [Candidatus Sulfopaludibacter sp. SbA3]